MTSTQMINSRTNDVFQNTIAKVRPIFYGFVASVRKQIPK